MANQKRKPLVISWETPQRFKKFADTLRKAVRECAEDEYDAIVDSVWRGLTPEERDLLASKLDAEIGQWQPLTPRFGWEREVAAAGIQGGCIPACHVPNSPHGKEFRSVVERHRLQEFLRSVVSGDAPTRNRQGEYKK